MAALALLALIPLPALADCTSPAGVEADMFYNTTHKRVQYCDGTNWVNMGVNSAVVTETDPQVGTLTNTKWCRSDGTQVICDQDAPSGGGGGGGDLPAGAVMAFNLSACPSGWTEYLPAKGRFIRGACLDISGCSDPSGVRTVGSTQADELRSHIHNYNLSKARDAGQSPPHVRFGYATDSNTPLNNVTGAILPTGGAETRPTNVALLYCQKS